ncbi:alpha/beta fold hydrolase [Kosmotoga pacifica]|uniref:Alpha/beta hydrolase n=1 Tax=Kosmotoga pacifica TaxID=1330330 RepID=A0A0G2ZCW1_9BACT|nr:alpha/beta hydrolase [Kosmotoga pacifica]AKI96603.1 alpha/beta hydrolase [Kosmotoga pacifica]
MAYFKYGNVNIYYELHGDENRPVVVLLNGIMMSTLSWHGHLSDLTRFFRVLLMDFRDQGKSSKMSKEFDISVHVEDLNALLDYLNIEKVNIVGLSYGGQVAQLFALKHPYKLNALVLANTPARIPPYLQELGEAWKEAARLYDGEKFFKLAIPFIYSDSFYNSNLSWLKNRQKAFKQLLNKDWFDGFIRLASSNLSFNTLNELPSISCPTLLLMADRDIITPIREMELIKERLPQAESLIIHDAGHAAFLEKQEEFLSAVIGFLLRYS